MNPMIMSMLENYLGKDRAGALMQQWNAMSPQQQQAEISKISSMSREEQSQYLGQKGINMNELMNSANSQSNSGNNNGGGRFNY